jgi:hypothetical protein
MPGAGTYPGHRPPTWPPRVWLWLAGGAMLAFAASFRARSRAPRRLCRTARVRNAGRRPGRTILYMDDFDSCLPIGLDPAAVIEAVARDPRLRAFTSHGKIETLPARQARRHLLLDKIAQAFEPGRALLRAPGQPVPRCPAHRLCGAAPLSRRRGVPVPIRWPVLAQRRYRAPVPAGVGPGSGTPRRAVMAGPRAASEADRTACAGNRLGPKPATTRGSPIRESLGTPCAPGGPGAGTASLEPGTRRLGLSISRRRQGSSGATPRGRFRAFILRPRPCSLKARRAGVPPGWSAGSPRRWRSVQGTRDVGHLQVEQSGRLELRGDPPD